MEMKRIFTLMNSHRGYKRDRIAYRILASCYCVAFFVRDWDGIYMCAAVAYGMLATNDP